MGKPVLKITRYKPEEIKELLNSDSIFVVVTRLNMVYQVAKGLSSREVAKTYGISFKQVINWVHRFEESGIQGLHDMPGRGRKSILSMVDLEKIREVVLNEPPENLGYNRKRWSGPLLLEWINKTYNTKYQIAQVYKLLNRMGVEFRKEEGYVAKN
jgi:transposase